MEQFTYSHNYIIKVLPADEITYEKDMCRYEIINVSDPTKKRIAYLVDGRYVCSCDIYFRHGIICRHIFSLSNVNQEKDLQRFVINSRWQPPLLNNNELQAQIDGYNFNPNKVAKLLQDELKVDSNSDKGENDKEEEKDIGDIKFPLKKTGKGAPKKEKRARSILERKPAKKSNFQHE